MVLTILGYSMLCAIGLVVKDVSQYGAIDEVDIALSGPMGWLLVGIALVLKKWRRKHPVTRVYRPKKEMSLAEIDRVIRHNLRVIKNKKFLRNEDGWPKGEIPRLVVQKVWHGRMNRKWAMAYWDDPGYFIRRLDGLCQDYGITCTIKTVEYWDGPETTLFFT